MTIQTLFCEIPSNPLLHTPDLHQIRKLADQYGFCVVCDETLGTYINVDILPYVDVAITSLTKIFSGGSNVMGGRLAIPDNDSSIDVLCLAYCCSAVINPLSLHYQKLHTRLTATYQDLFFPGDAIILAQNSADFPERVHRCSATAHRLVERITGHPSIHSIYYPTLVPTAHLYERYRRTNGGYGYVLSILFHKPADAVLFYDKLDIRKGPNIGTNFSLALPYAQLSHVHELDWAESNGVPKHIVRISVGLETEASLVDRVTDALMNVQRQEGV
jgi:cystathionine gamma-synthase